MISNRILIVDDEPNIIELTRVYLEREGFSTVSVGDGYSALEKVETARPALMILDIMLPEMDGFEVCRKIRAKNNQIPILMLTARDDDIDKILGLELGADDYLTKPFNPRELVARVKAILRRGDHATTGNIKTISIGDLKIDPARRQVFHKDSLIDLRTQEFEVLLNLAQHPEIVLTREQLLSLAWGYDFAGQTRTVDVHIAQIRKKINESTVKIETVTGIGYKLVP